MHFLGRLPQTFGHSLPALPAQDTGPHPPSSLQDLLQNPETLALCVALTLAELEVSEGAAWLLVISQKSMIQDYRKEKITVGPIFKTGIFSKRVLSHD